MGLSSQLAPSAIARPGVIANAAARPASPYDGQVIYQQDTDQAYVWNGSAWVLLSTGTANPPGLELITACTVSSSGGTAATISNGVITIGSGNTSVTVSNAFSSTYDNYKIVLANTTGSTPLDLRMQLSSLTTGVYNNSNMYVNTAGTVTGVTGGSSLTYWLIGSADTGSANSSSIDVFGPFTTLRTAISGTSASINVTYVIGGQAVDTNSRTGFVINTSTGSISGGTVSVYGYRK